MIWTLYRYIFREMGKVFLLTAIGLTGILSMCGGVLNMIRVEEVTAVQLIRLMAIVMPVSAALTLPVAALYAAAITYGRFSGDNEVNACRCSGININYLLLPAVVISLFSAAFAFTFINFVIPNFVQQLDEFVRRDLRKIVTHQLSYKGRLSFSNYRLYADDVRVLEEDEFATSNPDQRAVQLLGAAFIELSGDDMVRVGTARSVAVKFDNSGDLPSIEADMIEARVFDQLRNQYYELHHQPIGPYEVPLTFPVKPKWLNLKELVHYKRHPEEFPAIKNKLVRLRSRIAELLTYRMVIDAMIGDAHEFAIGDKDYRWKLESERMRVDPESGRPTFENPTVTVYNPDRTRVITAGKAGIYVSGGGSSSGARLHLELSGGVQITDSLDPDRSIQRNRERLDAVAVPQEPIDRAKSYTDTDLLDLNRELGFSKLIDENRQGISHRKDLLRLDVASVFHSRLAFSSSVVVLVILAAALGIIFRGGQALTAFGISFVPSLFVIVTIIMGKQIIEKPGTSSAGVLICWLGIAIVAALDGVVLAKVLKR